MSLQVICPGFSRTGTTSMKLALETLGFGPVHNAEQVFLDPVQMHMWSEVLAGVPLDVEAAFAGYNAQVDLPGALCWRDLLDANPAAKVILTSRDRDDWWASYSATIVPLIAYRQRLPDYLRHAVRVVRDVVERGLGCRYDDKAGCIAGYRAHNRAVREALPDKHCLLVTSVKWGWEPICEFLGVPVPDAPFPRTNSTKDFLAPLSGFL